MPFAEFLFILAQYVRYMIDQRRLPSQCIPYVDVTRRAGNPLLGAQEMGNLHQMIVNDMREMVGWESIRLENNEIIDVGILEGDVAVQLVMHNRFTVDGHGKAHRPGDARGIVGGAFLRAQVAAARSEER